MKSATEKAYAKINLYLDVISRRDDGFHNLKTVMHTVSLCDYIELSADEAENTVVILNCNSSSVPTDEKNLACRAAVEYLNKAGISASVKINLEKNIPVAAGLAGGSSDAAATLRAMNRIFGKLSNDELLDIAAGLGSDVPYCLVGGTAICEGRGEILTQIEEVEAKNFVIAIGKERVSTPWAYSRLDDIYSDFDGSVKRDIKSIDSLFNIFETAVMPELPEVEIIKSRLLKYGASGALMSGSGPSVFGIFDNTEEASAAANALARDGYLAFAVRSV